MVLLPGVVQGFKNRNLMRKMIVAGNWKMNLSFQQANSLVHDILRADIPMQTNHLAIFAAPFPYLQNVQSLVSSHSQFFTAAQNCHTGKSGAFTGEVSAFMLQSIGVEYVILGHSERREYFGETSAILVQKLRQALESGLRPIFCCGETRLIRDAGTQNEYVTKQLEETVFLFSPEQAARMVIAYEPIWAIGTGLTASAGQAQDMHAFIRNLIRKRFNASLGEELSIIYGGSCKPGNARELFGCPDVDGGLIGGSSLVADDFLQILQSF